MGIAIDHKKISNLTFLCQRIESFLDHLAEVLALEMDAIKRSDLQKVEEITIEKLRIGNQIIEDSEKIEYLIQQMSSQDSGEIASGITDLLRIIDSRMIELSDEAAREVLDTLKMSVKILVEKRKLLQPKIEGNIYLTQKLLQNHRETQVFWQSLVAESESVYGKSGKPVASGNKSLLTVRT